MLRQTMFLEVVAAAVVLRGALLLMAQIQFQALRSTMVVTRLHQLLIQLGQIYLWIQGFQFPCSKQIM